VGMTSIIGRVRDPLVNGRRADPSAAFAVRGLPLDGHRVRGPVDDGHVGVDRFSVMQRTKVVT
jgi:hypothetical protein